MPNTTYYSLPYPNPLDPAYADLWGDILNNIIITFDAAAGILECSGQIIYPNNIQYFPITNSRWPGRIVSATFKTNTGTVTADVKIDSVSVTSLNAIAVTSTESTTTATGANTFTAGQDISFTLSSLADATSLTFNLWIDRTGIGTP